MFEQTFVQTQAKTGKPWTVAASLCLQCMAVGTILLIPLLHPAVLHMPDPPAPHLLHVWLTRPPLVPQKTNSRPGTFSAPVAPRPFVYVPPSARTSETSRVEVPSADPALTGWAGPPASAFGPSLTGDAPLPPRVVEQPPASQPPVKATTTGPLRVSGGVESARLIYGPHPVYPPLAKTTRSQGDVKLEAVIAADGTIRNLRVVSGPPLLVGAALDAVRQWRYHPTLLNGVAVEVLTEIDISFTLTK